MFVMYDERHCLLECPKFVNERIGKVPVWLNEDPSLNNFIGFLKGENEIELKMLGMLCKSVQAIVVKNVGSFRRV